MVGTFSSSTNLSEGDCGFCLPEALKSNDYFIKGTFIHRHDEDTINTHRRRAYSCDAASFPLLSVRIRTLDDCEIGSNDSDTLSSCDRSPQRRASAARDPSLQRRASAAQDPSLGASTVKSQCGGNSIACRASCAFIGANTGPENLIAQSGDDVPLDVESTSSVGEQPIHRLSLEAVLPKEVVGIYSGARSPETFSHLAEKSTSIEAILSALQHHYLPNLGLHDAITALHTIAKCTDADPSLFFAHISHDERFLTLVTYLRENVRSIDSPRSVMRIVWALAKLNHWSSDVEAIIDGFCHVVPPMLAGFSPQEFSNVLWGLARLCAGGLRQDDHVSTLVRAVIKHSSDHLSKFTPQCLANSLWAAAKLEFKNFEARKEVVAFGAICMAEIQREILGLSPQGLANTLWAAAKLRLPAEVSSPVCVGLASLIVSEPRLLGGFLPQELSMTMWAFAKLASQKGTTKVKEVMQFASLLAEEALGRLDDFTPQGLSNLAWSYGTLNLLGKEAPRRLLLSIMQKSIPVLGQFPPQAVANLCWAAARIDNPAVVSFAAVAALDATQRMEEFQWQDLSGVLSALAQAKLYSLAEVQTFARRLVEKASCNCRGIGTQALLNIALSACRLGVGLDVLTPLAYGIQVALNQKLCHFNDIDARQWIEVQHYCDMPCLVPLARVSNVCHDASKRRAHRTRGVAGRR